MSNSKKNFCFCTLALGKPYRLMAKELARDLKTYCVDALLVIGTDEPRDFNEHDNVLAFKHIQQSLLHCYNDKRFIIEKAFQKFSTVIFIDADTKIIDHIYNTINFNLGIDGCSKNLLEHITKNRPQDVENLKKIANKLKISLEDTKWIGESLFIITKDNGKEKEFLETWGIIASYLELKKMSSGEGNIMGLAAKKVGWTVKQDTWVYLKPFIKHLDVSKQKNNKAFLAVVKSKLCYFYRLSKMRIMTLKNIKFYYF